MVFLERRHAPLPTPPWRNACEIFTRDNNNNWTGFGGKWQWKRVRKGAGDGAGAGEALAGIL